MDENKIIEIANSDSEATVEELKHKIKNLQKLSDKGCFEENTEEYELVINDLYKAKQDLYKIRASMCRTSITRTGERKIVGIIDNYIADYVVENYPMMVLLGKVYMYDNGAYKEDKKSRLQGLIKNLMFPDMVTHQRIMAVYNLVVNDVRIQATLEDINKYPSHWINFVNGMLDTKTGKIYPHRLEYKSTNQIPHKYIPNLDIKETVFYKFLQSRIPGEKNRQMLYEYMGYCLFSGFIFQKFLVLVGIGSSGKSVILNHMERLLGTENASNIPLQDLSERFTSACLLNKLCNICSDLSNKALTDSSVMKQLTGEDKIKGEYKGGDIFYFRNRAKFLFSCNDLPTILDERSNGFYRRLLVIRFMEQGEYIDDLYSRLEEEKECETLISYLVEQCKNAIKRGRLFESEDSKQEVIQLNKESDTVASFLDECAEFGIDCKVARKEAYEAYRTYCINEGRQALGKTAFFKAINTKGYAKATIQGTVYYKGFGIKFTKAGKTPFDR